MYPVKVDRKHTLHVRHDGTIAAVTIDGVRSKFGGSPPVVLDPQRLRGTLLRVAAAELAAAQAAFDVRYEAAAIGDRFVDAVLEVKEASNGESCGDEMEALLFMAAGAISKRSRTEPEGEPA